MIFFAVGFMAWLFGLVGVVALGALLFSLWAPDVSGFIKRRRAHDKMRCDPIRRLRR